MRVLRWVAGLAVVFFVICAGQLWMAELLFRLVAGWALYLKRVLPAASVNWAGVATCVVCLVVAGAIAHGTGKWLWKSMRPEAGAWRMRWTALGLTGVMLLFVAGMGATGVGHQMGWLLFSGHSLTETNWRRGGKVYIVQCSSNLRQIGQAFVQYAELNQGRLPDDLAAMLPEVDISPDIFVCPASGDTRAEGATQAEVMEAVRTPSGGHCSYVYYGRGLKLPLPPGYPLVAEPVANHEGSIGSLEGMNILFADGVVEWFGIDEAAEVLRARERPRKGK